jgi:hypothetical protein
MLFGTNTESNEFFNKSNLNQVIHNEEGEASADADFLQGIPSENPGLAAQSVTAVEPNVQESELPTSNLSTLPSVHPTATRKVHTTMSVPAIQDAFGEEYITERLSPTEISQRIAIDAGSTQTRCLVYDLNPNSQDHIPNDVFVQDSEYLILSTSIESIKSPTRSIENNLEMVIECKNPGNPCYNKRVIKGGLRRSISERSNLLASSGPKTRQEALYVNIIANTAITYLLFAFIRGHRATGLIEAPIHIALPSDDINSTENYNLFLNNICDIYTISFPRLRENISFKISKDNLSVISESDAVAIYANVKYVDSSDSSNVYITCGGRSTGISASKSGILLSGDGLTVPVGGNSILNDIAKGASNITNCGYPSTMAVRNSLSTGIIKVGAQEFDISDVITEAKSKLVLPIYSGIQQLLAINDLYATDVSTVYCSGRSFGQSVQDCKVVSPSIFEALHSMYSPLSSGTKFILLSEDNPVVRGLMYADCLNV